MPIEIADQSRVLFIGDSITDCGRGRDDDTDLGAGYAALTAAWWSAAHPDREVTFLNRGIGGNRVSDLRRRWDADCLDLKPDVLSILIGINDTARSVSPDDPEDIDVFERDYRHILDALPDPRPQLILIEPFLVQVDPAQSVWRPELDGRIAVVQGLTSEYGATYLPLDGAFNKVSGQSSAGRWIPDGVHPTLAGHALISQAWLSLTG
jgi:acyl-CoA thioesterase I